MELYDEDQDDYEFVDDYPDEMINEIEKHFKENEHLLPKLED
ncbi:hypothetical protein [Ureibacillus xyleni]|nr:hypothetical protein [Ureibacillus xyleni]